MNISLLGITLHVKDVERSKLFYEKLPGAKVLIHHAGQFAMIQIGAGRVGLLRADTESFHLEFESEQLDDTYREFLTRGFRPESEPVQRNWGRDFDVKDPSGNTVEVEQKRSE